MGIAVGGKHFDHTVADLNDGHIKGTATQVIYHDLLFFFVIQTISQSCCRRLVDDTFYIQTGDLACVLGSLTLRIVEIGRYRNDRFRYTLSQIALSICFQLLQDHCGDLLR